DGRKSLPSNGDRAGRTGIHSGRGRTCKERFGEGVTMSSSDPKNPKMKPMFLPEVENHEPTGARGDLLKQMRASGREYPLIWHLFLYRPDACGHLGAFTQEILRGDCPLSPGFRELIAAYTSAGNHCLF